MYNIYIDRSVSIYIYIYKYIYNTSRAIRKDMDTGRLVNVVEGMYRSSLLSPPIFPLK